IYLTFLFYTSLHKILYVIKFDREAAQLDRGAAKFDREPPQLDREASQTIKNHSNSIEKPPKIKNPYFAARF
ncbi:hypothetical protein, partial [Virgibacillus sp. MG-45]|uniref:hypothetical protein n=1 Tax=Virgibacillus sp. MG-45 TaxID=3102791 RepID=UPI002ED7C30C